MLNIPNFISIIGMDLVDFLSSITMLVNSFIGSVIRKNYESDMKYHMTLIHHLVWCSVSDNDEVLTNRVYRPKYQA